MNEIEQGTDAWKQLRRGKATASRIADIIAKTKTGWGASRANYAADLIAERLTGVTVEGYINAAMQHGTDTEPEARAAYEFLFDCEVNQVAFVEHPTIAMSGASPDGCVGDDGIVEFKCPLTATHLGTLLGEPIPAKYITQVMWQLACTGRKWCDWCSYDNRLPESMRLYTYRIKRDDALIASLEKEVTTFLAEVDRKVAELTARYERKAA